MKTNGIEVLVLGDFGPFSRTGKSIGYQVNIGKSVFLMDCGSPLFNMLGGHRLGEIDGLIITHCHDDHKRWFSDLALFYRYAPDIDKKMHLITSEDVLSELIISASPAIDRSLSVDSKNIIDIPFDEYVDTRLVGPRAKYRIIKKTLHDSTMKLMVVDTKGKEVGPDRAKIIISDKTSRPRMLFRDPESRGWVEPESFYPFSSEVFYEKDKGDYKGDGFKIEAVKAPVWHGIPGVGIRFSTARESLFFSSDTVHDIELWESLCDKKKVHMAGPIKKAFDSLSVIEGDINDYIERVWGRHRFEEAKKCFKGAIVVHDISSNNSTVHTDYERLDKTLLKRKKTLLTHSPDRMTSEWVLCFSGKAFKIKGGGFFEMVDKKAFPLDADIYHKEKGKYYVGYRSRNGEYTVYKNGNTLRLPLKNSYAVRLGKPLFKVDLYEDISGEYFPVEEDHNRQYMKRRDGKVELVEFNEHGSDGRVVKGLRDKLAKANVKWD